MRPLIAVTSGEPAGIGPDLCLRLAETDTGAHPLILADRGLLQTRARQLKLAVALRDFVPGRAYLPGVLDVLHRPLAGPARPASSTRSTAPMCSVSSMPRWAVACMRSSTPWSPPRCTRR